MNGTLKSVQNSFPNCDAYHFADLSWPASYTGYVVEQAGALGSSTWTRVEGSAITANGACHLDRPGRKRDQLLPPATMTVREGRGGDFSTAAPDCERILI